MHIKRLTLMDLAKKRRQHRYEVKKSVKLKQGDTVQSVVSRASKCKLIRGCLRLIRYFHLFRIGLCRRNPHINITKFIGESVEVQDKSCPKRTSSHFGIEEHRTGCTRNGTSNR
jgi:hypothetical protein